MKILISYSKPARQLVDIKLQFTVTGSTQLQLPAWRPGRYEIANYAQYIYPLTISKGVASIAKITKDSWEVIGNGEIEISYQFHAARMDAGSSWLDEEQLYLNFINCIPKIESIKDNPITVHLKLPTDYTVVSSLQADGHQLVAKNYSELVDSPFFASKTISTHAYIVANTTFFIHIQGDWQPNTEQLINDFSRFTQAQVDFFGGTFPSPEYHFLIQTLPYKHYHGVEHQNSTVITLGPANEINSPPLYKELLGISSHELFHAWNVTRIRPKEMTTYDFSKEAYHTTGFITEGLTTYYGDLLLLKSGVFTVEEYIEEVNTLLKRHYQNEGRETNTLSESSLDLWLDGYKLGSPHRKVSIYNEGALCALLLDLKIITESEGKFSLQNVMNDLWAAFGDTKKGYSIDDYLSIINKYINGKTYLDKYIFGKEPLENELSQLLSLVGFEWTWQKNRDDLEHFFGIKTILRGDKKEVVVIAQHSEAEEKLMLGDVIEKQEGTLFIINRRELRKSIELTKRGAYYSYYKINKASNIPTFTWAC